MGYLASPRVLLAVNALLALAACPSPLPDDASADATDLDAGDAHADDGEGDGEGDGDAHEGEGDGGEGDGGLAPVDDDHDGLDDRDEDALAHDYLPFLSNHPDDACPLSGIAFRARPHPDDAALVHVVYSRLYQRDCGIGPHPGDNEAFGVTIDPAAPAPRGLVSIVAISHQNTPCQRITTCGACDGLDACATDDGTSTGRPVVFSSKNKHGGAVDLERGCGITSCVEQCTLADEGADVPLVNVGEPGAPLVHDLSDAGFITAANGWTDGALFHFDPWSDRNFGEAGKPSEDFVDDAFLAPACHARPDPVDGGEGEGEGEAPPENTAPEDAFVESATFVPDGPLCDVDGADADAFIAGGGDPVNVPCAIEVDNTIAARDPSASGAGALHVVEWNIRIGHDHQAIVDALTTHPDLAGADVLLLTEVGRHDGETVPVGIDEARELALALGMNYAFAVEWDHRYADGAPAPKGEHGAAVLARFPLGAVEVVRHTPAHDWWSDKRLLGGRLTLGATLDVGGASSHRLVRVNASHFCTRPLSGDDEGRAVQGAEARADAMRAGRPHAEIVGGDFNTWTCNPANKDCTKAPDAERVVQDFVVDGWDDATGDWNGVSHHGEGFFPQRLDWVFVNGPLVVTPGAAVDVDGSDHLPLVFDVVVP